MNLQALFDALLALVALGLAIRGGHCKPAWRLACLLLAAAATLGALRFSGLLPMPSLHQFFSMLGAGVGLPLLALAVILPDSHVATQRRFAWIFTISAGTLCILLVMVAQLKVWTAACALLSTFGILMISIKHREMITALGALLLLLALSAFAAKIHMPPLLPGDLLHIGMALGLLALSAGPQRLRPTP